MTDKEFSELGEQEFDRYLEDILDQAPPGDLAEEITPWRRAMSRIIWGIGLTMLTVRLWNLELILPAIGMLMLLLGFRALRRENRWFRIGFAAACLLGIWWLIESASRFTVLLETMPLQRILEYGTWAMVVPELIMLLSLRNGIRMIQRKAGLPPHGGSGILVWYLIMVLMSLARSSGLTVWGLTAAYFFTLRSLAGLSRELDEAGYAVTPAPVRVSDSTVKAAYGALLLAVLILCYGFLNKYPMDWQTAPEPSGAAVEEVRRELIGLGFPEQILADMTEKEILACAGADFVLVQQRDYDMDQGQGIGTPEEIRDGMAALVTEDQAERQLRFTFVGVGFDGDRQRWKLVHHFRWLVEPDFCGTEAIQMWPYANSGCKVSGGFGGRVLYDLDGTTYASAYNSLGPVTYQNSDPISAVTGRSSSSDVFATFSMPNQGTGHRGYVLYEVLEMQDGANVSSWFNYVHQYSRFQFPVLSAMEAAITSPPNSRWGFRTIQTAFQFSTYPDLPELF